MTPPEKSDVPLFDLTLSEEQQMTRESLLRFAEHEMRPVARAADMAHKVPDGFLQKAHELGLTMAIVPEQFGGAGLARSPVSNVLVAEGLGTGDMSLALAALAPLGVVNLLLDFGSAAQQKKYLPAFAGESFRAAAVAIMEPRATFDVRQLGTRAVKQGNGYVINGVKSMVPLAQDAETFIVLADTDDGGPQAFIVDRADGGVTVEAEGYMGLRALGLGRIKLDNLKVGRSAVLGETERRFDYERFVDLSRLGLAATAVGVCDTALKYVIEYCNNRIAFGEPISHRQAVAFMIADIGIELDGLRLMVYRAASRAEQGLEFHREAYLAHVQSARRTMEIGTNSVQLLGGHGFTTEYLVELWYRDLRAAAILEGCATV